MGRRFPVPSRSARTSLTRWPRAAAGTTHRLDFVPRMEKRGRMVVKVGTGVLTGGGEQLDRNAMAGLVRQIAELRSKGQEVLLVSSGAIAAGRARLPLDRNRRDVPAKQVLAAIGQHLLMQTYDQLFAP